MKYIAILLAFMIGLVIGGRFFEFNYKQGDYYACVWHGEQP